MATARRSKKTKSPNDGRLDFGRLTLTARAAEACGLVLDSDRMQSVALRGAGSWWVQPLGRTESGATLGLRLVPGLDLEACPVVLASGCEVVTIAPTPAHLVPALVFATMLQGDDAWERVDRAFQAL